MNKDITFCNRKCANTECHRHMSHINPAWNPQYLSFMSDYLCKFHIKVKKNVWIYEKSYIGSYGEMKDE